MIAIMSTDCFERLAALADDARRLASGERLFGRGSRVRRLFLVEAGEVLLHRDTVEGGALVLQRAGAGRVLAEASLHAPRYHCDATATLDARVLSLAATTASAALRDDPELAAAWAAMLARELQAARSRAALLRLRGVGARLDAWLALNEAGLPPHGRRREVADEIGVTPEALYRELARRRRS